jgi:hypothetical protein
MSYFEQLNEAWQNAILDEMSDTEGGSRPEVAAAFKEHYAKYLSEVEIKKEPDQADRDEVGATYVNFLTGWDAAMEHLAKDQKEMIASWVRAHGEFTDHSDLEGEEYEAYIVKASDLTAH